MLIYSPDANNLNNFIANLRAFTENGGRKLRANATRVEAVSGVCLTFGVQNLNSQQRKALAEFLSGSDVFVNLPTGYQMAPEKMSETLQQSSSLNTSSKSINDVCRVFQRPFACMNDPEIKQICTRANKLFLHIFFLGLWTERILKPITLITLPNYKVY